MAASASSAAGRKLNPEAVIVIQSLEEWAAQIELSKQSKKLVVIDFTASWCGPCRMMAPMFVELATKFTDVIFLKVDVDELKPIAEQFNIQAMPTFLFMKDGDVKDKIVGARKDDLPKKIEQHK